MLCVATNLYATSFVGNRVSDVPEPSFRKHQGVPVLLMMVIAGAVLAGCTDGGLDSPEPPQDGSESLQELDLPELATGSCIVTRESETIVQVEAVDCADPRAARVTAVLDAPFPDSGYPGQDVLLAEAGKACTAVYASLPNAESFGRAVSHVIPTPDMWAAGDRRMICLATPGSSP